MSAIDRAFIKAYGEETAGAADTASAAPLDHRGARASDGAMSPLPENAMANSTRPRKTRRRLAPPQSTEAPSNARTATTSPASDAEAASRQIEPTRPSTTSPGEHKPKMVVGRRALQQLAESAGVPAPHAAFSQRPTNVRATDEAAGSGIQRVDQGLRMLECDIKYDLTANTRQTDDLSSSVSYVASPHYRVDPMASNSTYRHESAEPRDTWFRATSPSTNPPLATTAIRPLSTCLMPTSTEAPFATLEVDRFSWSPACDLLIQTVQADLESAAAMLSSQQDNDGQVIALASSELGEGCTTIAQCLARMLASADKRVCLIDADFEFPHLAETMGLSPERCLESLLAGEASVSEVLIESLEDGVTLLPLTRPIGTDLVERSKLRQTVMLGELRDHFDVILIDAGRACMPHRPACSILQAGAGIDAVILVRAQDTTRAAWRQAEQSIERWNLHCLGIIENRCAIDREERA